MLSDLTIDKLLYEVLEQNIVYRKSPEKTLMLCNGELITYNPTFRLYITTNHRNPHYLSEIASKISLIDFTLTDQGFEQKILSTIIAEERMDLQERRENYVMEKAKNTDLLYKLESNILEVLSSSEGNILEDENAINILSTSKNMSEEIQTKQMASNSAEYDIETQYQEYLMVARHATILYNCIMKLQSIKYVYQFSLNWFVDLFVENVRETPKQSQTLTQRLNDLNSSFMKRLYMQTIQMLYAEDRLVFLFLIWIEQFRIENRIENDELEFLLSSKYTKRPYNENDLDDLSVDWMSPESKHLLNQALMLPR